MRGLIGACLALGTLSNVVVAADLGGGSTRDPSTSAPVWSGLYVGAAVGYSFGSSHISLDFGLPLSLDERLRGEHGAVTVGYDFQLGPRWVAGVFADYALGTAGFPGGDNGVSVAIDNPWAIGGRLGVLATPSTLLYGSAGYTAADLEATNGPFRLAKGVLEGYFVGLGGEQALSRNLYLKVDYRFSAYGEMADSVAGARVTLDDNNVHSLRLGVSYRFGM